MLLTSPRNSIPAHVNLFKLLDCTILLVPNPYPPMISALTAAHKLHVAEVPNLDGLMNKRHPHYPYTKTFDEASHKPLLAFHTSGSTGPPSRSSGLMLSRQHTSRCHNWIRRLDSSPKTDFSKQTDCCSCCLLSMLQVTAQAYATQ